MPADKTPKVPAAKPAPKPAAKPAVKPAPKPVAPKPVAPKPAPKEITCVETTRDCLEGANWTFTRVVACAYPGFTTCMATRLGWTQ